MQNPTRLLLLLVFSALMLTQTACIEEGEMLNADVPRYVKSTFNDNFPGATNPSWHYEDHLYEVEFVYYGERWVAIIDCDGLLQDHYSLGEIDPQGRDNSDDNDTPRKPPARSN